MGGQGVEDLARVGEVGLERVALVVRHRHEVEVEYFVSRGLQVGYHMPACFARPAGEDDAFGGGGGGHCLVQAVLEDWAD